MTMKVFAYDVRDDEKDVFERLAKEYEITITTTKDALTQQTLELANGYDGVTILAQSIVNNDILDGLARQNIFCLSTRSIGYNHIDISYAHRLGIKVCNSYYAPNGVADFTVMLMLMSLRHAKQALWKEQVNDHSLSGLQGREMKDLTVGILGTGRIGQAVIKNLTGFGCKILAYDPYINENVKKYAQYVEMDELLRTCDVISLHLPLTEKNHHLINRESISKMKTGVILVNSSRGGLMDTEALIEGIENKKLGALALDVIEYEEGAYLSDRSLDIIKNKNMAYLRQSPNVVVTNHMAFYTDAAVNSMVEYAILGLKSFIEDKPWKYEIK